MDNKSINIKIKYGADQNLEHQIQSDWTVLKLKEELATKTNSKPSDMKIIFKGKILKDTDVFSAVKVEDGSTMHLVISKPQTASTSQEQSTGQQGQNQQQQQQPLPNNMSTGFGQNPFMGLGGMGGFGGMGGMGGMPPGFDPNNMSQMMSDPAFQQMFQSVLSNPQMMQNMIQQNPFVKQMVESNPQLQAMLSNPEMLQAMSDPAFLQQASSMMQGGGMGGLGALGGLGGMGAQQQQNQPGSQQGAQGSQGQQGQQPPFNMNNLMGMLNNPMFGGMGGMGGFQAPQTNSNVPPEERFKDQLLQLEQMGFTNKAVNIQALTATDGIVDAAVERILNMIG